MNNSYGYIGLAIIMILLLWAACIFMIRIRERRHNLWQTSYIDSMTGIGNLNYFEMETARLLAANTNTKYSVFKFDIENLKLLNEIYGYQEGNEIIQKLVKTIESSLLPQIETCARTAGDKFLILKSCASLKGHEEVRSEYETDFVRLISRELDGKVKLKFGIYRIEDRHESITSILEKVNYAHSICKSNSNQTCFVYDEEIKQKAIQDKKIEARMEKSLQKCEFKLYLQPKYFLADETLAGAEALVRWYSDEDQKIIYPNDFIPLFEKNGFILKLDMYMLEQVCCLIQSWIKQEQEPVTISINFSRLHLNDPNFSEKICEMTDRYQIPRKYIELELTESAMFNNEQVMYSVLKELHESGFTLSMDDFGTGYSSLGLLKNLPVDVIKIDRSFFEDSRFKTRAKAVVENVMLIAKQLQIGTVAEGIESEEHIELLKSMGCDMVQGYYYAKPMPAEEFLLKDMTRAVVPAKKETQLCICELGDTELGREDLGQETSVFAYRLFQNSLKYALKEEYGDGEMQSIMRIAGKVAGNTFAKEILNLSQSFERFISELSEKLDELKIGHLAVESFDQESGNGILTMSADLDCSGMANSGETKCQYDEGMINGILEEYTKNEYMVTEIDCWGTGADICRFSIRRK